MLILKLVSPSSCPLPRSWHCAGHGTVARGRGLDQLSEWLTARSPLPPVKAQLSHLTQSKLHPTDHHGLNVPLADLQTQEKLPKLLLLARPGCGVGGCLLEQRLDSSTRPGPQHRHQGLLSFFPLSG